MADEYGGFVPLALPPDRGLPPEWGVPTNSGRTALWLILRAAHVASLVLPVWCCDTLLEPLSELAVDCRFYELDERLEPADGVTLEPGQWLLWFNPLGLKGVEAMTAAFRRFGGRVIFDGAQALFASAEENWWMLRSARKFLGVPDGGFAAGPADRWSDLRPGRSWEAATALLRGVDEGLKASSADRLAAERRLIGRRYAMSSLTARLVGAVDPENETSVRRRNFAQLHETLADVNEFPIELAADAVPMAYPFLVRNLGVRRRLIDRRVYLPLLWPEVASRARRGSIEDQLRRFLLPLPIDSRYGVRDIGRLSRLVRDACRP